MLKLSMGNAKLAPNTAILNLPAGWSCPFAKACLSKADPKTGKIQDGPDMEHRCYAASIESRHKNARRLYHDNHALLKSCRSPQEVADMIEEAMRWYGVRDYFRLHSSGDFFSRRYFEGVIVLASRNPATIFYAYTKALPWWVANIGGIPANFVLKASWGGSRDDLIPLHNLPSCRVVSSAEEAESLGLLVDHDDSLARDPNVHEFAVIIHGTQQAGSKAAEYVKRNKQAGWTGYSRK